MRCTSLRTAYLKLGFLNAKLYMHIIVILGPANPPFRTALDHEMTHLYSYGLVPDEPDIWLSGTFDWYPQSIK